MNILSGGAAQGLVRSLEPAFEAETGLGIAGDFGAVGAMADRLRAGVPTDMVVLDRRSDREACRRRAGFAQLDHGHRPG
ncbi:substrate-binding domain-containing protein [Bradyrhizobium sp. 13971]